MMMTGGEEGKRLLTDGMCGAGACGGQGTEHPSGRASGAVECQQASSRYAYRIAA